MRLPWPSQGNEVFPIVPAAVDEALKAAGAHYYPWTTRSLPPGDEPSAEERMIRLICAFDAADADIDQFVAVAARACAVHAG